MKNLNKFYLVTGCICLSLTLFSFKTTDSSQQRMGDGTVYYQGQNSGSGSFESTARTGKLAKKVYQNDCRLVAYAVVDWATSIFDVEADLSQRNTSSEIKSKLRKL